MNESNQRILAVVDSKINDAEKEITNLGALVAQQPALNDRLNFATGQAHRVMNNEKLSEQQAVQALSEANALRELASAKLVNTERLIAQRRDDITRGHGLQARKYATEVAHLWTQHVLTVALAFVEEKFDLQPQEQSALARRTKLFVEAERLSNGVSVYTDDFESLRDLRTNFGPIASACANADGLVLTLPESWLPVARPVFVDIGKGSGRNQSGTLV